MNSAKYTTAEDNAVLDFAEANGKTFTNIELIVSGEY